MTEIIGLCLQGISILVILFGFLFTWKQLSSNKRSQQYNLFMQCEKDWEELNKLMIKEKLFRDIYRDHDKVLKDLTDDDLKQFCFLELYYAHLARVHYYVKSPFNPFKYETDSNEYVQLYTNLLKYMLKNKMFVEVHNCAKRMQTFEKDFRDYVDSIIQKTITSKEEKGV